MINRLRNLVQDISFFATLLINYFTGRGKYKVNFCVWTKVPFYSTSMASTRIRVFDVIKMFQNDEKYLVSLLSLSAKKRSDLVIFQKKFSREAISQAVQLKSMGVKTVLDINVNYYNDDSTHITTDQKKCAIEMSKVVDAIITPSKYIHEQAQRIFKNKPVYLVEEQLIQYKEIKKSREPIAQLVWCGYSQKAKDVLLIKNVLMKLSKSMDLSLLIVSEKNPELNIEGVTILYKKFNQFTIQHLIRLGQVFIAPRNLSDPYNLGHTFTKIGLPMSLGIPIVASPVPSYVGSPAIICRTNEDWFKTIKQLLKSKEYREDISVQGLNFTKIYSSKNIKHKYMAVFSDILGI